VLRDDLSNKLIHLTRGNSFDDAAATFTKIVTEKRLLGGTGCIKGRFTCVCFSEAPLSKLTTILANPMAHGMRYKPFGVMLDKTWLFEQGGRPVIYQPDSECELLIPEQRWRHVRYEPQNGIDFTWEREWRIHADELALDPMVTTFVIPNRDWERRFHDEHLAALSRRALVTGGFVGPKEISDIPWHFVVLEDLGVEIPKD
jgi:hypothetical protein